MTNDPHDGGTHGGAPIWGTHSLEPGRILEARLGALTLWVRKRAGEWGVAWEHRTSEALPEQNAIFDARDPAELPPGLDWTRRVLPGDGGRVRFIPVMPDRPVVVRPAHALVVSPGAKATLDVRLPVWMRAAAIGGDGEPVTLCEVPAAVLSRTWFGTPEGGELCYSLNGGLEETALEEQPSGHHVICTVRVENTAPDDLNLARLCLRVPHLSIYDREGGLWAGVTSVKYQGGERPSDLIHDEAPPEGVARKARLSAPRVPQDRSVMARTFSNLRAWLNE